MPSLTTPLRRTRDQSFEDESNASVATPPTSNSPRSRKKARHHLINGASSTLRNGQTNGSRQGHGHTPSGSEESAPKAPLVHQPGSIVRVKLENFVTYASGEFFPGPSLNMVIGPNGTGKSTLVCAICLGLGWGPQHLGRAKDISEFVKHGAREATIEIELCRDGRKYKTNPVIRCIIRREGNKTLWTLNGRSSTKKQVLEVAHSFSIQIDNLCQFLPQDRVVEFAAMSPVELLRSTQRAVASQDMIVWHEELITMRQNQRQVEQENTSDREMLANLENRQRMQEADVQRLRERDEVKEKIRLLEAVRPVADYREKKAAFEELEMRKKVIDAELQELEAEEEPNREAIDAKQRYCDAIQGAREDRIRAVGHAERKADADSEKIETLQSSISGLEAEDQRERGDAKKARQEAKRLDGVIAGLQKQLDQGPGDFDVAACTEQLRESERQLRALKDQYPPIREQLDNLNRTGRELNTRIEGTEQGIKALDSQAGQQEVKLGKISPDTLKAWQWIREHQDEFESPILGPPALVCSVRDPRYADLIESLMQTGDLITFTAQTKNDQNKLHNIIKNQLKCYKTNTRCALPMARFRPSIDDEQRQVLGFEGWALQYLQGPEPVLAMLCEAAGLHRTGVSYEDTSTEVFEQLKDSAISQWVTKTSIYRVQRRREYGPGATSTVVRAIRKAQVWSDQPVDASTKRELQQKVTQLTIEREEVVRQFAEQRQNWAALEERKKNLQEAQQELKQEKEVKQRAAQQFNALPVRLAQQEEKRNDCLGTLNSVRNKIEQILNKQCEVKIQKAQAALSYVGSVQTLHKATEALQEAEIMLIEAQSDVDTLEQQNSDARERLAAKRREAVQAENDMRLARQTGKRALEEVKRLQRSADAALTEFMAHLDTSQTREQLEDEIESEKARLELMHGGDSNVIAQFEEREQKIMKLNEKLEEIDDALQEIGEKIAEVREKWEPKLDQLVKRISSSFSYNMAQISCNGQVDVQKEEDFDQWAIIIHVQFREHEPLTRLDSHRQSGGERAVSTIFYLMSLQSLTRSPFRVVDEINQGMDPRNERLVHARMVAIATGNDDWRPDGEEGPVPLGNGHRRRGSSNEGGEEENEADSETDGEIERADLGSQSQGSQYFLVTPKLLHDLRYEEGMKVLCIVSGEHMMDPDRGLEGISFNRSLEIRRRMNGKGKGRAVMNEHANGAVGTAAA